MGIPFVPVYLITILVLLVVNSCPIVSENLVCCAKWYRFFQVKQYNIFDNAYEHFDFPQWEKTFRGVGRPSTSQDGMGDGEKDVCICDYRVWTVTDEGCGTYM